MLFSYFRSLSTLYLAAFVTAGGILFGITVCVTSMHFLVNLCPGLCPGSSHLFLQLVTLDRKFLSGSFATVDVVKMGTISTKLPIR